VRPIVGLQAPSLVHETFRSLKDHFDEHVRSFRLLGSYMIKDACYESLVVNESGDRNDEQVSWHAVRKAAVR
jgi:hypothetical protein